MLKPSVTKRIIGALFIVGSCTLTLITIFEPEINYWLLTRNTPPVHPPRGMVIRSASPEIERIAAFFVRTGLFDVFVALPGKDWLSTAEPIVVDDSKDCQSAGMQPSRLDAVAAKCIHRKQPSPLPACRTEIDLDGLPDSIQHFAQAAQIYVIADGGHPCPFLDPKGMLSRVNPILTSRVLPYFVLPRPRPGSVKGKHATLTLPTPESILSAIGIDPASIHH